MKESFTDVKSAYFASKRRNRIFALVLGTFATLCMAFIGMTVFAQISGFHLSLPVPEFVKSYMSFGGDDKNEPEKLNILLTGIGGE